MQKKVIINANVITMDEANPRVEALGISKEVLSVVGSREEALAWGGDDAEVIDLAGATVVPGLIDSHSHISIGSLWLDHANCSTVVCATLDDVFAAIKAKVEEVPIGQWVQGYGFDDTGTPAMRHLTRSDLDAISTTHPIFIAHVSGHLAYLNSAALAVCEISANTPDPAGGEIHKDENGLPSGLLLENAAFNARTYIPQPPRDVFKTQLKQMIAHYNAVGLTSTHDAAVGLMGGADYVAICHELEKAGGLNIRIYADILAQKYDDYDALGISKGFGSTYFRVGGIKFFQDGSIQGLTGALLEDYACKPGHRSELIFPQEELNAMFAARHASGDHIIVHGNGDAAIESILQAFEYAQAQAPRDDARHMLIHAQMASDNHIDRMKALGVIPSFFINHVYYWGDRHKNIFLGPERAARINPLGSALARGLLFSVHTDYPITPIDPIHSMHIAVNRTTRSGEVLGPDERISALEALKTYTTLAAICSFEEDIKGSLAVGKLADLTVLSEDILAIEPERIEQLKVLRTVVGGKTVFQSS